MTETATWRRREHEERDERRAVQRWCLPRWPYIIQQSQTRPAAPVRHGCRRPWTASMDGFEHRFDMAGMACRGRMAGPGSRKKRRRRSLAGRDGGGMGGQTGWWCRLAACWHRSGLGGRWREGQTRQGGRRDGRREWRRQETPSRARGGLPRANAGSDAPWSRWRDGEQAWQGIHRPLQAPAAAKEALAKPHTIGGYPAHQWARSSTNCRLRAGPLENVDSGGGLRDRDSPIGSGDSGHLASSIAPHMDLEGGGQATHPTRCTTTHHHHPPSPRASMADDGHGPDSARCPGDVGASTISLALIAH